MNLIMSLLLVFGGAGPQAAPVTAPEDEDDDLSYTTYVTKADGATIRPPRFWLRHVANSLRNVDLHDAERLPVDRYFTVGCRRGRGWTLGLGHRFSIEGGGRAGHGGAIAFVEVEYADANPDARIPVADPTPADRAVFPAATDRLRDESNSPLLHSGDKTFTAGGWFRLDSTSGAYILVAVGHFLDSNREWVLFANNGDLFLQISTTGSNTIQFNVPASVVAGVWLLVLFEHNATDDVVRVWFNGTKVLESAHSGGLFSGTEKFSIGNNGQGIGLVGAAAPCAYWNRALTQAEHTFLASARKRYADLTPALRTDSLVAYWDLDDESFGSWADAHDSIPLTDVTGNVYPGSDATTPVSRADGASLVVPAFHVKHTADSLLNAALTATNEDRDRFTTRHMIASSKRQGIGHRFSICGDGRAGNCAAPLFLEIEYTLVGETQARVKAVER